MGVKGWGCIMISPRAMHIVIEAYCKYYPKPRCEETPVDNVECARIRLTILTVLSSLESLVTYPRPNHLRADNVPY